MGLVQYLHRRALLLGAGTPSAGLPLDREMRKDKQAIAGAGRTRGLQGALASLRG